MVSFKLIELDFRFIYLFIMMMMMMMCGVTETETETCQTLTITITITITITTTITITIVTAVIIAIYIFECGVPKCRAYLLVFIFNLPLFGFLYLVQERNGNMDDGSSLQCVSGQLVSNLKFIFKISSFLNFFLTASGFWECLTFDLVVMNHETVLYFGELYQGFVD